MVDEEDDMVEHILANCDAAIAATAASAHSSKGMRLVKRILSGPVGEQYAPAADT
jgi:hypothetical protein